jgi:hypothetical protein
MPPGPHSGLIILWRLHQLREDYDRATPVFPMGPPSQSLPGMQ